MTLARPREKSASFVDFLQWHRLCGASHCLNGLGDFCNHLRPIIHCRSHVVQHRNEPIAQCLQTRRIGNAFDFYMNPRFQLFTVTGFFKARKPAILVARGTK